MPAASCSQDGCCTPSLHIYSLAGKVENGKNAKGQKTVQPHLSYFNGKSKRFPVSDTQQISTCMLLTIPMSHKPPLLGLYHFNSCISVLSSVPVVGQVLNAWMSYKKSQDQPFSWVGWAEFLYCWVTMKSLVFSSSFPAMQLHPVILR